MALSCIVILTLLSTALFYQTSCQKTAHHAHAAAKEGAPTAGCPFAGHHSGQQEQGAPELRHCGCSELEQCYREQTVQLDDLFSRCRHECGLAFLTNDTAEHVANCYDVYGKSKRDRKGNKRQCVENLIGRPCLTDQHHQGPPSEATLTIDPTTIIQHRLKRNYKSLYPNSLNLYASCVKTCRKSGGVAHFNADGVPVKTAAKTDTNTLESDATKANLILKPEKGYELCAAQLNCQLVPIDKKLVKQAKQICKYQTTQAEDHELALCTCLEGALKHSFHCLPPTAAVATDTCSSSTSESGEKADCGETRAK